MKQSGKKAGAGKLTKKKAVIAAVVLCVLSSSLLLNLSVSVIAFLAALVVIVLIYANTYAKKIVIENDLDVDYTSSSK